MNDILQQFTFQEICEICNSQKTETYVPPSLKSVKPLSVISVLYALSGLLPRLYHNAGRRHFIETIRSTAENVDKKRKK